MRYEAGKEVTFVPCSSTASKCIQMSLGRNASASEIVDPNKSKAKDTSNAKVSGKGGATVIAKL